MTPAIRRCTDADAPALLALLQSEGESWADYHRDGPVYVMSDVDAYYEKIGGERVGSVFTV